MTQPEPDVPQSFLAAAGGDSMAMDRVIAEVYDELRRLAGAEARRSRAEAFQPTALVHEAYLRLRKQRSGGWSDQGSFLAVAARVMRRVMIDHARAAEAQRRGGSHRREGIEPARICVLDESMGVLEVHDLLEHLASFAAEEAQVAELLVFGGLSIDQVAETLKVSASTVDRRWRFARAWLVQRAASESSSHDGA